VFDAEGERVVGTHGLEYDVGPVVGELSVDLVGPADAPAVFAIPRGSLVHAAKPLTGYSIDVGVRGDETSLVTEARGGRVRMNIFVTSVLRRVPTVF
jgi:hypothetical protein